MRRRAQAFRARLRGLEHVSPAQPNAERRSSRRPASRHTRAALSQSGGSACRQPQQVRRFHHVQSDRVAARNTLVPNAAHTSARQVSHPSSTRANFVRRSSAAHRGRGPIRWAQRAAQRYLAEAQVHVHLTRLAGSPNLRLRPRLRRQRSQLYRWMRSWGRLARLCTKSHNGYNVLSGYLSVE